MPSKHDGIVGRADILKVLPQYLEMPPLENPRQELGDLSELRESIRANGVLVPLIIKRRGDSLIVVSGHRRLTCVLELIAEGEAIESVPCKMVAPNLSDIESLLLALGANDGKPLTALEEAEAYFKLQNWGVSVFDIARRTGRSESTVRGRLELRQACPSLRAALDEGKVTKVAAHKVIKESKGDVAEQKKRLGPDLRRVFALLVKELDREVDGDYSWLPDEANEMILKLEEYIVAFNQANGFTK